MNISAFKKATELQDLSFVSLSAARVAKSFHASFPMYQETPLVSLKEAADFCGVRGIYVKDESLRFGLNAFKVLGGSYAIGNYIAERLHLSIEELTYENMLSEEVRNKLGDITFVTATDGNHGRGVAWTAAKLKQKSVIYMPKGSSPERLNHIRQEGAEATITEYNYDGCVRLANRMAEENGWILVQDTSWEGYTDIPAWIIQGYATMALEAYEQLPEHPTHIFIQAGVGSLAAAVAGFFASVFGNDKPMIITVEPEAADCIYRSAKAGDGARHIVEGDMNTIMAGLACGEPCSIGWDILRDCADYAISCPDDTARTGMRLLAHPYEGDPAMISGESGAAGFGCVAEILTKPELKHLRDELKLDGNSVVLAFSTEGATDRNSYQEIVENYL